MQVRSLPVALGLALLLSSAGEAWAQSVTVDLNDQKQMIQGFGGINHPIWVGDLTADQRETAFGNGPDQLGFTVLRIFISENSSNWSREVATAQRAQELGVLLFASPWNPPSSMATTINGEKHVNPQMYAEYAAHLTDFYNFMQDNGVDLYSVSIQNEPDYAMEWTWWSTDEIVTFLRDYGGSFPFRVMAPESFQYRKQMSDPILNDSAALANLDILGAHLYGTQVRDFPYPLFKEKGAGKELWMTEVYYPNSDADSNDRWDEALSLGVHMHNAMVEAEFQAYVWWYIRRSYGPMKENGTISKRGYTMAQFSKFVRRGFVRVEATADPANGVYVSAYRSNADVVAVVVNTNSSSQSLTFSIPGANVPSYEQYTTSSGKSLSNDGTITASGDSFTVSVDGQSVITLHGTGEPTGTVGTGGSGGTGGTGGAETGGAETGGAETGGAETGGVETGGVATVGGSGGTGSSDCVGDAQNAYLGSPASIPGTVQAEDFDPAGYSDTSAGNEGGAYRTDEDVDIKDLGGGYAVGWMNTGEWLEYTVDVAVEGDYLLGVVAGAVDAGRTLDITACGVPLATVDVPQIADWGEVETVTASPVHLSAGLQVIRVTVGANDYIDFDAITFELIGGGTGGTGGTGGVAGCTVDSCDDANPCTSDSCEPTSGACTHAPISGCCLTDTDCSSSSVCLQAACDVALNQCTLAAISGCCSTALDCDDGNPCSTESCDAATGTCSVQTVAGCCQLDGDCDDQNVCTTDTCDASTNQCANVPVSDPACGGSGTVPAEKSEDGGGCGCRFAGGGHRWSGAWPLLTLLGAGIWRRRRRHSPRGRKLS